MWGKPGKPPVGADTAEEKKLEDKEAQTDLPPSESRKRGRESEPVEEPVYPIEEKLKVV